MEYKKDNKLIVEEPLSSISSSQFSIKLPDTNSIKFDNKTLRIAVDLWFTDKEKAIENYGDISTWDVSKVTNMNALFSGRKDFNENISNWNVSNVTKMDCMFWYAESFNQDLITKRLDKNERAWDVSNVTSMYGMFRRAASFNGNISNWNTSNVTRMDSMFYEASSFNRDINTKIIYLKNATPDFYGKLNDNLGLEDAIYYWDVSKVTTMKSMFQSAESFKGGNFLWDVSNVTNMKNMFQCAYLFNDHRIGLWNINHECLISDIFRHCKCVRKNTFTSRNEVKKHYGQKIAEYFDPPLPNYKSNNELLDLKKKLLLKPVTKILFKLAMRQKYKKSIIDNNHNEIVFNQISHYIDGKLNENFPVIENLEELKNIIENLNNRDINDNKYTDSRNKEFVLFKVDIHGNKIPLFYFDENDNLIVEEIIPQICETIENEILSYI
jgi:surface protein